MPVTNNREVRRSRDRSLFAVFVCVAGCAHGSAENTRTTLAQQDRMRERANGATFDAPPTARISNRHGPKACLDRWVYESETKFDTCLASWESTEVRHAQGNTRADKALAISAAVIAGAAAARQPSGFQVLCNDGQWSPTCVDDGDLQGCCSRHDGVYYDASRQAVIRR